MKYLFLLLSIISQGVLAQIPDESICSSVPEPSLQQICNASLNLEEFFTFKKYVEGVVEDSDAKRPIRNPPDNFTTRTCIKGLNKSLEVIQGLSIAEKIKPIVNIYPELADLGSTNASTRRIANNNAIKHLTEYRDNYSIEMRAYSWLAGVIDKQHRALQSLNHLQKIMLKIGGAALDPVQRAIGYQGINISPIKTVLGSIGKEANAKYRKARKLLKNESKLIEKFKDLTIASLEGEKIFLDEKISENNTKIVALDEDIIKLTEKNETDVKLIRKDAESTINKNRDDLEILKQQLDQALSPIDGLERNVRAYRSGLEHHIFVCPKGFNYANCREHVTEKNNFMIEHQGLEQSLASARSRLASQRQEVSVKRNAYQKKLNSNKDFNKKLENEVTKIMNQYKTELSSMKAKKKTLTQSQVDINKKLVQCTADKLFCESLKLQKIIDMDMD